jgi:hypothetical protein
MYLILNVVVAFLYTFGSSVIIIPMINPDYLLMKGFDKLIN